MKSLNLKVLPVLCAAAAWNCPAMAQVDVSIGSSGLTAGGQTTVSLDISGLSPGTPLGGFDLNVGFNSTVLSLTSENYGGTSGDQLNPGGAIEGFDSFTTPGTGTIELSEFSLETNAQLQSQPTSFELATLTFTALQTGTSPLTLSVTGYESGPTDLDGNALAANYQNGLITVSGGGVNIAPEIDPASGASALTLLLGSLALCRGRRRAWRARSARVIAQRN